MRAAAGSPIREATKKGVTTKDLVTFTRQFATMIDSGLPLVQCLDILAKQASKPSFGRMIAEVTREVESGSTLSDALGKHKDVFDDLFRNMVAAGEAGGVLDEILMRLATYIEKADALKRKVQSALVYPAVVLSVAGGATSFAFTCRPRTDNGGSRWFSGANETRADPTLSTGHGALAGIEAEILPTGEVLLDSREGLDIVLASFHGAPSEEVYYRAVLRAVTDPKVDVLAHHAWIAGYFAPIAQYDDELVELMADNEVAIELNSKHALPSWDFLQKCKDAGVKYTIGSDAHKAADVGSVAWARNTARHIFKDEGLFIP